MFVAIFAVYALVYSHDFVSFDDPIYVTENAHVQAGLSGAGLAWALTTFHDSNWFPLTWLSHMLDVQLFGLDSGPQHLTNVLLHALSAVLLFVVLRRMTGARWPSAVVALLFGLHPLHVESVAWIAERKDVLSALFWMLTLWAYAGYVTRPTRSRYFLTLLLFCLGLMAKPMLVTLPLVLVLLDLWPLRRGVCLLEKLPFFAASLASSIVAYVAHQQGGAVASFEIVPLATRVENALITYVVYLLQAIWPARLAVFYPYPLKPILVPAIFAAVVLVGITTLAIREFSRRPYLTVGWLWYGITLLPVIGLVQTGSQARADRYTYIPLIGVSIAVVWGLSEVLAPWRRFRAALAIAAVVACAVITAWQVRYWRDSVALYQHAIDVVPENYLAHFNLAAVLESQGRTSDALAQLREAVSIRPTSASARAELGQMLAQMGHADEALEQLQTAVNMRPNDPVAQFRLGSVLGTLGRPNDAAAHFLQVVRLQPENAEAHYNLGLALAEQDKLQDAAREFSETIKLRPQDAEAHFNLGVALARLNQIDQAIAQFSEALRLKPDFVEDRQALEHAIALRESRAAQ